MSPTTEAATLGSLLWNPAAVTRVRGWLGVIDFADPWHAEVYRVLLSHTTTQNSGSPAEAGLALRARLGPRRTDLPRFAALAGDAPHRPDIVAYARLVLEASLHRQIATYGLVLRAGTAAACAQRHPQPLHDAVNHVQSWTEQARGQWHAARHGGQARVNPDAAATARHDILLGADRFLVTHPTPTAADLAQAEGLLVGALLTHPSWLPTVAAIRAEHLTDPLAGAALAVIRSLARAGEHIDAVTVTAQLARRTPDRSGQVGTRLVQWAHAGGIRDLDHICTTVLLNTALSLAAEADQAFREPTSAPLLDQLAVVGARLDGLRALADALAPELVPARSRLSLAPPAPRSAADDAFVLEVG